MIENAWAGEEAELQLRSFSLNAIHLMHFGDSDRLINPWILGEGERILVGWRKSQGMRNSENPLPGNHVESILDF